MNYLRAVFTVSATAFTAIMLLLLPGGWRGLAVLPVFAWLVGWSHLGPHLGRHVEDYFDEYDDEGDDEGTADPGYDPFSEHVPELDRLTGPAPSVDVDPVGHYSSQAWARTGEPWQQRGPLDEPHLLSAPLDASGPGMRPPSLAGPGGHEPELEGQGEPREVQAAELETWPDLDELARRHADEFRFALVLEHVRSSFSLLRRMYL
jgi:hypothetical protein